MRLTPTRHRTALVLVAAAMLLNKWTLEALVVPDGHIERLSYNVVLWGLNLLCLAGALYVELAPREHLRTTAGNLALLAGSLLGLLVLLVLVEVSAFGLLLVLQPDRLPKALNNHPFVGGGDRFPRRNHVFLSTSDFHPLWGWQSRRSEDRDAQGFRLNHPTDTRAWDPRADYNVVLMGGSTVAGYPSPPARTISAYLERRLNRRAPPTYNVVNAGHGGWHSVNQVGFLLHRVLPFQRPDLLVVMDGVNDAKRAAVAARKFHRSHEGFWDSRDNYLYDPKLELYLEQFRRLQEDPLFVLNQMLWTMGLTPYLDFRRYMSGRLTEVLVGSEPRDASGDEPVPPEDCREVPVNAEFYLTNVRTTLGAARSADLPALYVLQPSLVFKQNLSRKEKAVLRRKDGRYFRRGNPKFGIPPGACWSELMRSFFRRARTGYRRIRQKRSDDRRRVLDGSGLFQGTEAHRFYDGVHYTHEANRAIARRLEEPVRNLLPPRDTR